MTRSLFPTQLYESDIGDERPIEELAHSIRMLSEDDVAGRRWSAKHRYAGYTSYASLNDLPTFGRPTMPQRKPMCSPISCPSSRAKRGDPGSLWIAASPSAPRNDGFGAL
jgi:hypothetical protein